MSYECYYVVTKVVKNLPKRTKVKRSAKRLSATMKTVLFLGFAAAVLVGVLLAPTPGSGKKSGIELFGENPEVEVYGPELPQSTVGGYPVAMVESVVLPDSTEEVDSTLYVYASDDQECYHLSTCRFAFASGHKFTVYEALLSGFKPCGICNPPSDAE